MSWTETTLLKVPKQNLLLKAAVLLGVVVSFLETRFLVAFYRIPTTNISQQQKSTENGTPRNRTDICFVTYEIAFNGRFLEPLANLTKVGIRLPNTATDQTYRYLAFTNDADLDNQDWEKVLMEPLDPKLHIRPKTTVVKAKLMAWQHPATASCRTIFTMDGTFVPVPMPKVWEDLDRRVHDSPGGLLLEHKPDNASITQTFDYIVKGKKDTEANANHTLTWLKSRPGYSDDIPCIFLNFVGYDPANILYQRLSLQFWQYYSTETLTLRDQPLFSYFVDLHKDEMKPAKLLYHGFGYKELRPTVNLCSEASRIRKGRQHQQESQSLHRRRRLKSNGHYPQYTLDFDPNLVQDLCDKKNRVEHKYVEN
eukprot:scaffold2257_cov169-Amphora_coffeaeformis.AAC.7